ncbi:hypothetical protein, partial [Ensifer sp. Root1252]|uniref:hypothetical protein n=1 Tax=Ensifer sp. Root1252 TaxID=1736438 RepID=UPI001AED0D53
LVDDANEVLDRPDHTAKPPPENCPGFSGITVRELLKTVSGDYRKPCPDFAETRSQVVLVCNRQHQFIR